MNVHDIPKPHDIPGDLTIVGTYWAKDGTELIMQFKSTETNMWYELNWKDKRWHKYRLISTRAPIDLAEATEMEEADL